VALATSQPGSAVTSVPAGSGRPRMMNAVATAPERVAPRHRLSLFCALPMEKLERLRLERAVREIASSTGEA
jgi:hypothetical protein